MPTVIAGASQTISIAVGEAYRVSIADGSDAYVDLLSGAPGSPYASPRLRSPKTDEIFGPYPSPAQIRLRVNAGSATYAAYVEPKPVTATDSGALVGLARSALLPVLRTEAVVKHIGSSSNNATAFNQTTGLSTSDMTVTVKLELEAFFSAVRLALLNRAQNAINGNTAVVGVSETNATDTSANMASPIIGGTAYAQIAPSGTLNGWRAVTWGGASSVDIGAASAAQQFALSDWVNLGSVARTDGGARPLLLWRTWRPGAASGNWSFNTSGASARTASAAMRGRTMVVSQAFSNAVTTLGATFSLGTTVVPAFPVVRFNVPVLSVWGVGDSTMQNTAQAPENLSAWGLRACNDVSTPSRPVVWANFGAASQTAATAWAIAKAALAAGCPAPSVLVIQPASVNDPSSPSSPNVRDREGQVALAMDVVATARQYGIPYVVWAPLMPFNSLTLAFDEIRKGTNAQVSSIAETNGVHWLNFSALGNGASPERWVTAYNDGTGAAGDGIHPDETAFDDVMAPEFAAVLRSIMA